MEKEKIRFKRTIRSFYKSNKRNFPWRKTSEPYSILVSEIMLQQTQTGRVIQKYSEFLKTFPDFETLANAKTFEVLKVWSGLGYNRRALFLQQSAEIIHKEFKDDFPLDPNTLQKLPGIGKATARSLLVFSKNIPLVFIETNIRRVFIYFFFSDNNKIDDKEIEKLIGETLDKKHPRDWYYALMDYGAMLGRLKENPNKKSLQYSKQSKFEGSVRKIRGEIIRLLLSGNKTSLKKLEENYKEDLEKYLKAVKDLEREKIIRIEKSSVEII